MSRQQEICSRKAAELDTTERQNWKAQISADLRLAFEDYPLCKWLFDGSVNPVRALEALTSLLVDEVAWNPLLTIDRIKLAHAVALWIVPSEEATERSEKAAESRDCVLHDESSGVVRKLLRTRRALEYFRPREPYAYLYLIGVNPTFRRQGLGTALLMHGLSRVDEIQLPAFLETAERSNISFYQRFGFYLQEQYRITSDSPITWCMYRPVALRKPT